MLAVFAYLLFWAVAVVEAYFVGRAAAKRVSECVLWSRREDDV